MNSGVLLRKVQSKLRRYVQNWYDWRDQRVTRFFRHWVLPTDFAHLSFVAPTRNLRLKMLKGPNREPETRIWIDEMSKRGHQVLWDVGANVGSFSVYAASKGLRVIAVEPMPHNLMLLVNNISKNRVEELCTVLPLAVSRQTGPARMRLASQDFGSAGHGFGTDQMFRGGLKSEPILEFAVCGTSIDDAVRSLGLPEPTCLKVDVDGNDDAVIYGAHEVLDSVQSICCEVKFDEIRVAELVSFLNSQGFKLKDRTIRNAFFERP